MCTKVLCCALLVLAAPCLPQRTSVVRDYPRYNNGGKPDLVMDPQRFVSQMEIVDRYFEPTDCAIAKGVVGGSGHRRLLRFDTVVMNRGDGDLVAGDRGDPNNPYADRSSSTPVTATITSGISPSTSSTRRTA
jgi:hypothetical protein